MNQETFISTIHRIKFHMTVPKISELIEFTSPIFFVAGTIPWTVQIRKEEAELGPYLDVNLMCVQSADMPGWEYAATFYCKLLSVEDDEDSDVKVYASPNVYNVNNNNCIIPHLVDWDELYNNNYVQDDKICLQFGVDVADPNQLSRSTITIESGKQCCNNSGAFTFLLKVTNIENLMAVRTSVIKLRGLDWFLQVFKGSDSDLGVSLHPGSSDNSAAYKIRMISELITTGAPSDRTFKKRALDDLEYNDREDWVANEGLISWHQLFKPEYGVIVDSSIKLQVNIEINELSDSESDSAKSPSASESENLRCPICFDKVDKQKVSCPPCGHIFCTDCVKQATTDREACPTCNGPLILKNLRRVHITKFSDRNGNDLDADN